MTTKSKMAAVAVITAVALLGAACSSPETVRTSGEAAGVSAAIQKAKAAVAELKDPAVFEVAALSAGVPAGKVVAQVNCTNPVCNPGKLDEPVEALGWKLEGYDFDLTKGAEDFLRAFDAAIAAKPDYLAINFNYGTEIAAKQLHEAKSASIPVFGLSGTDMSDVVIMGQSYVPLEQSGSYMADIALADAGKAVHVAVPTDPSLPSLASMAKGVTDRLADVKGSSADLIELSFAQPQPTNISAIINYLQSHPATEYLLFPGTGFYAGLHQALKSAGLADRVKLVLAYAGVSDLPTIKNGEFIGAVAGENSYYWRLVDAMARFSVGDSTGTKTPSSHFRLLTQDNASEAGLDPANFREIFRSAWRV